MRIYIISILFTTCIWTLHAQVNDDVLWATLKLVKEMDSKTSIAITPILRLNNGISDYQNSSLDFSLRRKLANKWQFQVLSRTWWIPEEKKRQFLWLDVIFTQKWLKTKLVSNVRYHYALDINNREDPDFIRWKTKFTFPAFGGFSPSFALEPWIRMNGFFQLQRMRYEPGINYKFNDRTDLTVVFRREESENITPYRDFNMLVVVLQQKL